MVAIMPSLECELQKISGIVKSQWTPRISEIQLPQNHVAAIGHLTMKNVESFPCLRRRKKSGLVLPRRFFLRAFSRKFPAHLFLHWISFGFGIMCPATDFDTAHGLEWNQRKSYTKINASGIFGKMLPKKSLQ